jgi:hypothetical protein
LTGGTLSIFNVLFCEVNKRLDDSRKAFNKTPVEVRKA